MKWWAIVMAAVVAGAVALADSRDDARVAQEQAVRQADARARESMQRAGDQVRRENERAVRQEIKAAQAERADAQARDQAKLDAQANRPAAGQASPDLTRQQVRELIGNQPAETGSSAVQSPSDGQTISRDELRQMIRQEIARQVAASTRPTTGPSSQPTTQQAMLLKLRREAAVKELHAAAAEHEADLKAIGPGVTEAERKDRESADKRYVKKLREILDAYGFSE